MLPSGSVLHATASRLNVNLHTATEEKKLLVYKEAVESMINTLYEISLDTMTKKAIKIFEKDIREMTTGLRKVNKNGVIQIKDYLEKAQVKATLVSDMFGRKEEEASRTRLQNRYEALIECRGHLERAKDYLVPLVVSR